MAVAKVHPALFRNVESKEHAAYVAEEGMKLLYEQKPVQKSFEVQKSSEVPKRF